MKNNKNKLVFILICAVYILCVLLIPAINYLRNLTGDYNFPPLVKEVRYPTLLLFLVFFIAYGFYLKFRSKYFPNTNWTLYGALVLFLGIFACTIYPIFSIDLYEFIMRGRIWSLYKVNPYLHPPSDFKNDLFYSIIFWKFQPMAYGPVWTWLLWLPTKLAGNSVFLNQFFMKLVLFIVYLLSAQQVYRLAKLFELKNPIVYCEAFLLNPFMVVSILVDGHNDIVMTFFLLWSLVELKKGRDLLSLALLVLSVLTKYVTAVFVPLYVLYYWFKYKGISKKSFFALKATALSLIVAALVFKPFWAGLQTFQGITSVGKSFHDNTITYLIFKAISLFARGLPDNVFMSVSQFTFVLFYIIILIAFSRTSRGVKDVNKAVVLTFGAYFALGSFQFGSWYLVWIVPFILFTGFPMAFLLQALVSFAALISFWKRISLLLVAAMIVYFVLYFIYNRSRKIKPEAI